MRNQNPNQASDHAEEETEYHFGEDDITYEIENEYPQKKASAKSSVISNTLSRLDALKSKRVLISGVIFLALVFLVYRMLISTSVTNPIAELKSVPTANFSPPATAVINQSAPNVQNQAPQAAAATPAVQQVMSSPVSQQPNNISSNTQISDFSSSNVNQTPGNIQQMATSNEGTPAANTAAPIVGTIPPAVMPVTVPTAAAPSGVVPLSQVEARVNEVQAEYAGRLTDVSNQNKFLIEEVKTLNTRLTNLESELSQLLQLLMKTNLGTQVSAGTGGQDVLTSSSQTAEVKLPYTVQAIIPGRAWLRSDGGETVTITVGDTVKDAGRVTKIDPYDGIVEINTGKRVVTLSYGSSE